MFDIFPKKKTNAIYQLNKIKWFWIVEIYWIKLTMLSTFWQMQLQNQNNIIHVSVMWIILGESRLHFSHSAILQFCIQTFPWCRNYITKHYSRWDRFVFEVLRRKIQIEKKKKSKLFFRFCILLMLWFLL